MTQTVKLLNRGKTTGVLPGSEIFVNPTSNGYVARIVFSTEATVVTNMLKFNLYLQPGVTSEFVPLTTDITADIMPDYVQSVVIYNTEGTQEEHLQEVIENFYIPANCRLYTDATIGVRYHITGIEYSAE